MTGVGAPAHFDPAGYALRLPKGSASRVEEALGVVPAQQRDAWRLHRVEYGDTLASVAKRYSTSAASLASANGGELPQPGLLAAIPAAYPGDPVKKASAKPAKKASQPASRAAAGNKPAGKPTAKAQGKPTAKAAVKAKTAPKTGTPVARSKAPKSGRRAKA